jgi:predicted ribosome quality control (RQC) complex YloA/Tae2 family protein
MRKELSSFDIYQLVLELQDICNSYIDKIYQLSRNDILIRINNVNKNSKENIFVRNAEFLCVTRRQFKTPIQPTTFAMTLRKYLSNGKITEISQHEFDRIIKLKVVKGMIFYYLVIELLSNGNIILVDENNIIITCLVRQTWAYRKIRPREKYIPPPPQINPFTLSLKDFTDIFQNSDKDVVRTLAIDLNLGGTYAEEICVRGKIDKNASAKNLSTEEISALYNVLTGLLNTFREKKNKPIIVIKDSTIDVFPIKLEIIANKYEKIKEIDTLNEGLEKFIDIIEEKEEKKEISEDVDRLLRQKNQQEIMITALENEIKRKLKEGETLYLNYDKCDKLLKEIKEIIKEKDKKEHLDRISKNPIVKEIDLSENKLVLVLPDKRGDLLEVKINPRFSISKNAEIIYEESKKLKAKLERTKEVLKKTVEDIKKLKEKKKEKEKIEEKKIEKRRIFWFEKFRWFISSENNVVIAGRDAKSNEIVVKKYLKQDDRYVHADIHGAPSCIVKSIDIKGNKIPITENTLREACQFATSFSKAWKQFGEAQAYWVLPEQVSKTPQSGEYLPKGAFVIRGRRNYQRCKLELAIGEIKIDNEKKIMCAPVDAVKSKTNRYIIIEPGDINKNKLAKQLSKLFNISTEEMQRLLPPGDARIVKIVGF